MDRLIAVANLPFLFFHEMIHYIMARALGMDAEMHSCHTVFYPEDHGNTAILAVILAPFSFGVLLMLTTAVLLLVAPQWWIIPVHTGLLSLWFFVSSLSDIHAAYTFFRRGYWPTIENPAQLETVEHWLKNRLRSRMR